VKNLDGASLAKIDDRVLRSDKARETWLKLYEVSSAADPVSPNVVPGLYCAITGLDPQSYAACYCKAPTEVPAAKSQ
jgi:hypothetical protein